MTNYYTDADLSGAGEFVEPTVTLATEFTLPAGNIASTRSRFPTLAGATPLARIYNAGGMQLFAGGFDTGTADAWNTATIPGGLTVSAGTYRVCVTVTRYVAKGGFFSGGSVTRGDITGVQSRFDSGDVAPTQTSTATYFVDLDFTATGSSAAPTGLAVALALGTPAVSLNRSAAPNGLVVSLGLGVPRVTGDDPLAPGVGPRRFQSTPRGRRTQSTPRGRST